MCYTNYFNKHITSLFFWVQSSRIMPTRAGPPPAQHADPGSGGFPKQQDNDQPNTANLYYVKAPN